MSIKPFTKDDWPQFLGKAFTRKTDTETGATYADVVMITTAIPVGVVGSNFFCLYRTFAENYVFAQTGKPAGIEVKE